MGSGGQVDTVESEGFREDMEAPFMLGRMQRTPVSNIPRLSQRKRIATEKYQAFLLNFYVNEMGCYLNWRCFAPWLELV